MKNLTWNDIEESEEITLLNDDESEMVSGSRYVTVSVYQWVRNLAMKAGGYWKFVGTKKVWVPDACRA